MTVLGVLLTVASLVLAAWVHVRGAAVLTAGGPREVDAHRADTRTASAPPAVSAAKEPAA